MTSANNKDKDCNKRPSDNLGPVANDNLGIASKAMIKLKNLKKGLLKYQR